MNLKTFALSAALACFLLAPAMPVQAQTIASKVENQGDSRYIKVTGLMARERNGLLQLQIELANGDNEPQKAYYRIKWLDDGGFQVWVKQNMRDGLNGCTTVNGCDSQLLVTNNLLRNIGAILCGYP